MKTFDEQLGELQDTIQGLERHIQGTKVTPLTLKKTQEYLDYLEKQYPANDRSTKPQILFYMYELQALIDIAKGNVRRAKAFISEALDLDSNNQFASETARELISTTDKNTGSQQIPFFVVSPLRFVLMLIATAGLYSAYWFYKNWQAVEKTTGRRQYPLLSGIFAGLVSYNLFVDIKKAAENNGWNGKFSPGWRAVTCFLFGPLALIGTSQLMYAAGGVKHNKTFNKGEVILLIFGLLYWGLMIIGAANDSNSTASYRSTFINECQSGAKESGTFSPLEAQSYCSCVYDHGTNQYGHDEFISRTIDLGKDSSDLSSSSLGMIITDCAHQVESV